jgi:hypothetical protein
MGIWEADFSGLSEIASSRIDRRRSSTFRASHSLRISAILSSEIRGVEIKTCSTWWSLMIFGNNPFPPNTRKP